MAKDTYENPLVTRYASREMSVAFSPHKKFSTWRRLWLALADLAPGTWRLLAREEVTRLTTLAP